MSVGELAGRETIGGRELLRSATPGIQEKLAMKPSILHCGNQSVLTRSEATATDLPMVSAPAKYLTVQS